MNTRNTLLTAVVALALAAGGFALYQVGMHRGMGQAGAGAATASGSTPAEDPTSSIAAGEAATRSPADSASIRTSVLGNPPRIQWISGYAASAGAAPANRGPASPVNVDVRPFVYSFVRSFSVTFLSGSFFFFFIIIFAFLGFSCLLSSIEIAISKK